MVTIRNIAPRTVNTSGGSGPPASVAQDVGAVGVHEHVGAEVVLQGDCPARVVGVGVGKQRGADAGGVEAVCGERGTSPRPAASRHQETV